MFDYTALFSCEGVLLLATEPTHEWMLGPNRLDALTKRVRAHHRGQSEPRVEACACSITRLEGKLGPHYLVALRPPLLGNLSRRQREIAEYAAAGATAREIADSLGIGYHTVRQHLKEVYRVLGIASRVELVRVLT
ncbi:helix-turn-helix domain-containing protein [Nannocystaceae bacterium ST9]